ATPSSGPSTALTPPVPPAPHPPARPIPSHAARSGQSPPHGIASPSRALAHHSHPRWAPERVQDPSFRPVAGTPTGPRLTQLEHAAHLRSPRCAGDVGTRFPPSLGIRDRPHHRCQVTRPLQAPPRHPPAAHPSTTASAPRAASPSADLQAQRSGMRNSVGASRVAGRDQAGDGRGRVEELRGANEAEKHGQAWPRSSARASPPSRRSAEILVYVSLQLGTKYRLDEYCAPDFLRLPFSSQNISVFCACSMQSLMLQTGATSTRPSRNTSSACVAACAPLGSSPSQHFSLARPRDVPGIAAFALCDGRNLTGNCFSESITPATLGLCIDFSAHAFLADGGLVSVLAPPGFTVGYLHLHYLWLADTTASSRGARASVSKGDLQYCADSAELREFGRGGRVTGGRVTGTRART
ncbi:hypothetical protein BJ912DRAFT_951321, partial [Pholiota molesta]